MTVNTEKTKIFCINGAQNSVINMFIEKVIILQGQIPYLAFGLVTVQLRKIILYPSRKKIMQKLWLLRHLIRAGKSKTYLCLIYIVHI